MRELSNTNGSDGYGETPGEIGSSPKPSQGKLFYQDLIRQANTVPILNIFKHYSVRVSEHMLKTTCPFKTHKGGRESTPSFYYYPNTNSYWCFGCKNGHLACDFVAEMDGTTKAKAAYKILSLFKDSIGEEDLLSVPDASERLEIMLDFSNMVRDFRSSHFEEKDHVFIENICLVYDDLYDKYNSKSKKLDNAALRSIVDRLKEKVKVYSTCPNV